MSEAVVSENRYDEEAIYRRAYAEAEARGIRGGARVRVIGPDSYDDTDAIGSLGHISYTRGPWESWVSVDRWNGLGTTFPNESLEPVESARGTGGAGRA